MEDYRDLSDQERRKLYRQFSEAIKEIRVNGGPEPEAPEAAGNSVEAVSGRSESSRAERLLFARRSRKRPRYAVRLRIESYAYGEGFEISGLRQFFASLLGFLWPSRDRISVSFAKALVQDSAYRGDPDGYSLIRTLLELKKSSESLLKGGLFLRRDSDRRFNLRTELARDLLNWEPAGYRLLASFQKPAPRLMEALEYIRTRFERQNGVNVFDLVEVVKGVYRITLGIQAESQSLEERILSIGELIKGMYKRVYTDPDRIRQVCARIDHQLADFLVCYTRLKWFAQQLYPALLKMLNMFCKQEDVGTILADIYSFVGLDAKDVLVLQSPHDSPPAALEGKIPAGRQSGQTRPAGTEQEKQPVREGIEEEPAFDFNEEFRGILTILDYAFPGSRLQRIAEGDYSSLLWFHQRIFSQREYRGPLISRRRDFNDLLWKMSFRDPLAPVIVFHELIGQMLDSLNSDSLVELADPLRGRGPRTREVFMEILRQWGLSREELLLRYLQEVDYLEKEISLRGREMQVRFLNSAAGRKTIETVNQIRNHVIRGYGHVALIVNREEYFRCRPLYRIAKELHELLGELIVERDQLSAGNPIARQRLERGDLFEPRPGPLLNQIRSYIEALPEAKRILDDPQAEANRLYLEILFALTEAFQFLLNDPKSPLKVRGAEVPVAGSEEKAVRAEIDADKTPLRVDLKKDFEEVDRLTGLCSKNEYLRIMPGLFRRSRQNENPLSLLIMDLDRFKAINDTRGHDFGDEILKLAAEVVLSSAREEDLAVRFGGDELLVVVKGAAAAALGQAERIRGRYHELLRERFEQQLQEIPALMARKELAEKQKADPHYERGLQDFQEQWEQRALGTLSIGVAQGLGRKLPRPCQDEKELFRRADRMLYLAKDMGGDRVVAMIDELEVPLSWQEYSDYLEYLAQIPEAKRSERAKLYVDLRLAHDQALSFWNYPYQQYVEEQ